MSISRWLPLDVGGGSGNRLENGEIKPFSELN